MASPGELVDLAVTAEANGWDGVFLWDHLTWFEPEMTARTVDPWVTLGAIAQATTTVTIGTLITPLARRRPQKVAKEISTLDELSGGRAVLGVGLGVPVDTDFEQFGDETDARARGDLLDAGLDHLAQALGDRRPPVWVAGQWPNPRPFRRAARWDGVVPLIQAEDGGIRLCSPDDIRTIVAALGDVREGFDVATSWDPAHDPADYEAAGVTWLLSSWDAEPGWVDELRAVAGGPPA